MEQYSLPSHLRLSTFSTFGNVDPRLACYAHIIVVSIWGMRGTSLYLYLAVTSALEVGRLLESHLEELT